MLKNKNFMILLIMFVALLLLSSNCFATINIENNGEIYNFPNPPYADRPYFISTNFEGQDLTILVTCRYTLNELKEKYSLSNDKEYKLIYSMRFTEVSGKKYVFSWLLVSVNDDGTFTLVKDLSDNCGLWLNEVYVLSSNNSSWELYKQKGYLGIYYAKEKIIYSNIDIYNGIKSDDIFFQAPPQGILAPIVEGTKMETTLQEVIHLLPLIIVVVVSFLGLRKALQMLSTLLRRA